MGWWGDLLIVALTSITPIASIEDVMPTKSALVCTVFFVCPSVCHCFCPRPPSVRLYPRLVTSHRLWYELGALLHFPIQSENFILGERKSRRQNKIIVRVWRHNSFAWKGTQQYKYVLRCKFTHLHKVYMSEGVIMCNLYWRTYIRKCTEKSQERLRRTLYWVNLRSILVYSANTL